MVGKPVVEKFEKSPLETSKRDLSQSNSPVHKYSSQLQKYSSQNLLKSSLSNHNANLSIDLIEISPKNLKSSKRSNPSTHKVNKSLDFKYTRQTQNQLQIQNQTQSQIQNQTQNESFSSQLNSHNHSLSPHKNTHPTNSPLNKRNLNNLKINEIQTSPNTGRYSNTKHHDFDAYQNYQNKNISNQDVGKSRVAGVVNSVSHGKKGFRKISESPEGSVRKGGGHVHTNSECVRRNLNPSPFDTANGSFDEEKSNRTFGFKNKLGYNSGGSLSPIHQRGKESDADLISNIQVKFGIFGFLG